MFLCYYSDFVSSVFSAFVVLVSVSFVLVVVLLAVAFLVVDLPSKDMFSISTIVYC